MTKKLEELFNLDNSQEPKVLEEEKKVADPEVTKAAHEEIRSIDDQAKAIAQITKDLPQINELELLDDKELDHLAQKAEDAYDDLMDLGMNVESRYSGRVFEVAGTMLKTNLDAKVAKLDKKLKMVELQLKKQKMDQDNFGDNAGFTEGEGYVVTDRNSLLEKLKGIDKDK